MGVLYDVLFKPIGRRRRDGGSVTGGAAVSVADAPTAAAAKTTEEVTGTGGGGDDRRHHHQQTTPPPEWVLDERDGGLLVWRRYGGPAATALGRRRVEFLDAVQVRVFERYDHGDGPDSDSDDEARDADAEDDADDGQQPCWADDWCWDEWDEWDDGGGGDKRLFCARPGPGTNDCPVLVAVSVTVLGLCFVLAYMFAPVRWLFHQLAVD